MDKTVFLVAVFTLTIPSNSDGKEGRYITTSPQNVAAFPKDQVKFQCRSNLTLTEGAGALDWIVTPVSKPSATVVRACELNPEYEESYTLEAVAGGACNIIVLSVSVNEAGGYLCQDITGFNPPQSAQLVLLESDPSCFILSNGVNATEAVEGDIIRVTCTVSYTPNLSPLSTRWTNTSGQDVVDIEWTEDSQFTSYVEFPAVPPSIDPLTAFTFFSPPVNPPTTASNTPPYNYTWTSPELRILYCPTNLSIASNGAFPGEFAEGDNLTCYSAAYPPPTYYWTDLETGQKTYSKSIIIPSQGDFRLQCTAYNYISGSQCSANIEANGTASAAQIVPRNTALLVGSNGTLNCRYGSGSLSWVFTGAGQPGVVIAPDCDVLSSLTGVYSVDRSDGACNLIIIEAITGLAGIYTCQEKDSENRPPTAHLTILHSDPVCGDNLNNENAVAGERVQFNCSVNYTGNLVPTMIWSTARAEVLTNATNLTSSTEVRFLIDVPINPDILESFLCETRFPTPSLSDSIASIPAKNQPDYEYTWNSTERIVYYCVTDIKILPSPTDPLFVGDVLKCSASGYPPPTYEWLDLLTDTVTEGPILNVSSAGTFNYRCTARNTIDTGAECSISTSVDTTVYDLVSPENVAVESGSQANFSCRYRSSNIFWIFTAFDSTSAVAIVSGCQVLPPYTDKYAVSLDDFQCDLILLSADETVAGTYTCQDPQSPDASPPSSVVVVLESTPDCYVNMTGCCDTRLSCSVNFTGQLAPRMNWTDSYGQPVNDAVYIATRNQVTSYIDITPDGASSSVLESFYCRTYFDEPQLPSDGQTTPAMNAPSYVDLWESPTILLNSSWPGESCPTLLQQNVGQSNSYAFNRDWNSYRDGFGSLAPNSSYWIGLDKLSQLTSSENCSLHIDLLEKSTNKWYAAEYSYFEVDSSATNFSLYVSGYEGNAGDAFQHHNATSFSTYDNSITHCSETYSAGFWWQNGRCFHVGINNSPNYYFYWVSTPEERYIYLEMSRLWLFCSN